jgi:hypothetical protein
MSLFILTSLFFIIGIVLWLLVYFCFFFKL